MLIAPLKWNRKFFQPIIKISNGKICYVDAIKCSKGFDVTVRRERTKKKEINKFLVPDSTYKFDILTLSPRGKGEYLSWRRRGTTSRPSRIRRPLCSINNHAPPLILQKYGPARFVAFHVLHSSVGCARSAREPCGQTLSVLAISIADENKFALP